MRRGEAAGADLLPEQAGRHDVQHRELLEPIGMVERQPVADAGAAIVPDQREAGMAELGHGGDHIGSHLTLRVGGRAVAAWRV